jgi:hypothetical protein
MHLFTALPVTLLLGGALAGSLPRPRTIDTSIFVSPVLPNPTNTREEATFEIQVDGLSGSGTIDLTYASKSPTLSTNSSSVVSTTTSTTRAFSPYNTSESGLPFDGTSNSTFRSVMAPTSAQTTGVYTGKAIPTELDPTTVKALLCLIFGIWC